MSWGVPPWLYPVWDSLGFLDLGDYFLPHLREVFNYYLFKYFLMVFLFVFFFWDSYDSYVGAFNIALVVSEVVLISFNSFFSFPRCYIYFHYSTFHLTHRIFCLGYSTVGSLQSAFDLIYCIIDRLFFISSRSLLNIFYILSILVSSLFICNSILFSRFWIICTIIILNSFSGRLLLSSSFVWFGGHLSCSFTC